MTKLSINITVLLLIAILGLTKGELFVPYWICVPLVVIDIIILAFYIIWKLEKGYLFTKERFTNIENVISNSKDLTNNIIKSNEETIKSILSSNHEVLELAVNDCINSLKANTEKIIKEIETQNIKTYDKAIECISSIETLNNFTQSSVNNILSIIDKSQADILDKYQSMNLIINENSQSIENSISEAFSSAKVQSKLHIEELLTAANKSQESLIQISKEQTVNITHTLSEHADTFQQSITKISNEIGEKTNSISTSLIEKCDEIKDQLKDNEIKSIDAVNMATSNVIETLGDSIDSTKTSLEKSITLSAQISKENSNTLQQSITKISSEIAENTDFLNRTINSSNEKVKEQLVLNEDKNMTALETSISKSVADLSTSIELKNKTTEDSLKKIIKSNEDKHAELQNSFDELKHQNDAISTIISENVETSSIESELALNELKEQFASLHNEHNSIHIKTQNIEEALNIVIDNNDKEQIISSLDTVIYELKQGFSNSVSSINNEILDSRILQGSTYNEISNLQVLLRSALKVFEDTYSISQKQSPESHINLNRTDTIIDEETNNIVLNIYKDGHLVESIMKDKKGNVIYEVEYINNKITRSKNYDSFGKINIEQTYYENGQVHYRNEFTNKGKKVTEFDINGKKK